MLEQSIPWWKRGIIYQIYPRSFQDSNSDGIGDLKGITRRLDYVKSLNVDAIWISPIFPSPMHDFGYDVADYTAIHPIFGSLQDFDEMLARAHALGLRILLDLVPNHTSDEHAWFLESRSSRNNPKRDWYIWRDPGPNGEPPNNWLSSFGGSAWEWDENTGQFYLHSFVKQQPDLNYRNPEVIEAMLNVMRFWLDRGVDGFRVDVITAMVKDDQLLDDPENPDWDGIIPFNRLKHVYSNNHPEVHTIIRKMRQVLDSYPDRVMVGEIWSLPNEEMIKYYGENEDECHLPFNFGFINIEWKANTLRHRIENYERVLPPIAWPNWVLGNHDEHRIATRVGPQQARLANMLLLTLRGTPTAYYGDELGMEDGFIPLNRIQDPPALNQPEIAHIVGRDPERTPMQWDASPNAGFTGETVQPWLPVADQFLICNVAAQEQDPGSILHLFRALTQLRQREPALALGDYQGVRTSEDDVILAYQRRLEGHGTFLIVLNLSSQEHLLDFRSVAEDGEIVLNTTLTRRGPVKLGELKVLPDEGLILKI